MENMVAHAKFIKQSRPLIDFVESKGGPKFPKYCDVRYAIIDNVGSSTAERCSPGCLIHNPPSVTAVICMWIMDVIAWAREKQEILAVIKYDDSTDTIGECDWMCGLSQKGYRRMATKELAFFSILTSICESLGYKGDNQ